MFHVIASVFSRISYPFPAGIVDEGQLYPDYIISCVCVCVCVCERKRKTIISTLFVIIRNSFITFT